ncbi:MAG: TonB-dependent receptor [Verrucomicrobiota bacterium]
MIAARPLTPVIICLFGGMVFLGSGLTMAQQSVAGETAIPKPALETEAVVRSTLTPLTLSQILDSLGKLPSLIPSAGIAEPRVMRNLSDVSLAAPNSWLRRGTVRQDGTLFLRGVGGSVSNPDVTTYLDGVPQFHGASANVELLDIEEVVLLAGPQGTALPSNSLGGALRITSRRPSLTHIQGEMESTYGNYNLYDFRGRITTPLIRDQLGFSFAGGYQERDGYSENPATGHDLDSRSASFGKAQFLWTPDPALEVRLILSGESARDGDDAINRLGALRRTSHQGVARDLEGHSHRDVLQSALQVTYHGERFDFTSTTGYTWWQAERLVDLDQSAEFPDVYLVGYNPFQVEIIPADRTASTFQKLLSTQEQYSISQQFQLANPAGSPIRLTDSLQLDWQIGTFFHHTESEWQENYQHAPIQVSAPPLPFSPEPGSRKTAFSQAETTGLAAYLNTQWTFWKRLKLRAGLRWDGTRQQMDPELMNSQGRMVVIGLPQYADYTRYDIDRLRASESFLHSFTPEVSLSFELTPNLLTYFSFAGGRQPQTSFKLGWSGEYYQEYDQARNWSYEWGIQGRALKDRAHYSLALFYTDLQNLQLDAQDLDRTSNPYFNSPSQGDRADAFAYGLETTFDWSILPGWQLYGQASLNQAAYRGDSVKTLNWESRSIGGNQLPYSPDYSATAGTLFTWQLPRSLSLYAGVQVQFIGPYHFDSTNEASQEAFTLTNFRLGLRRHHWFAEIWAQNAFDTDYVASAYHSRSNISNSSDDVYFGENGPPVTFGLRVGLRF